MLWSFVILGVGFFAVPWSGAKYQLMFDFRCTVNAVLNLFKQYKKFTFVECLACQKVKTGSYILNCQKYIYDISFYEVFISFWDALDFTFLKSTIIFNSSTGDDSWNDNFGIIIFNSRTKENIIFVNCDGSEIVAGTFEVICQLKGFLFNCSHRRILNFLIRIDSRNGTEFIVR